MTREELLAMLANYNLDWDRAHKRYLQLRLSADHEAMTNARIMIDRINRELDEMEVAA